MGPLPVVVLDVLLDDEAEVGCAERDDVVEAFTPNGSDEALSVSVEIGTSGPVASDLFEQLPAGL